MRDSLQIFTAQNGQLSAKVLFANDTARHLHSLVDPSVETGLYDGLSFWGDIIVFVGLGLGYHIAGKIFSIPKRCAIIAIDYYDELLQHCQGRLFNGLATIAAFVSSSNIHDMTPAIKSILSNNPGASVQIVKHPASYSLHKDFYASALDLLAKAPLPRPSPPPAAADRAMLFHGNFFLEEEVRSALKTCAVEPVLFDYNNTRSMAAYEDEIQRLIQDRRPSFVLSINMKGFDANGALEDITARLGVPVVVWFVDDPRPILMHRLSYVKNNMVAACWEKSYLPYLQNAGFSKAIHAPLATDPGLFSSASVPAPQVNLGFVGTAMVDGYAGNIRKKFLWSESLSPLVELVSDRLLADPLYPAETELLACAKALSVSLPFSDERNLTWLRTLCIHTASMKKRKNIIGGLFNEGMETFGDPEGWKSLLGPRVRTHPNVDYRHGLRGAYRDIRINVNITSCQMPSAINQRVFDIPCCGSFVLSDDQKDLHELFDVGKEAAVYESIGDLKEKLRFYQSHEPQRLSLIEAARARIMNEHTYVHRIRRILDLLR